MTEKQITLSDELENEELEEPTEPEPESPRDIDKLLGLPYSEMTEEEIEIVVNYKVTREVESKEYQDKIAIAQNESDQTVEILKEKADSDTAFLRELTQHAINRFNEVS